jgi:hypothetical protein
MSSASIRQQEDELLRREGSLRRSRVGAVLLLALFAWGLWVRNQVADPFEARGFVREMLPFVVIIFLGIKYHLQIQHINSIKMYRGMMGEKAPAE